MAKNDSELRTKSNIDTLINIFSQLSKNAEHMQKSIINQQWENLYSLAKEQEDANKYLNTFIKDMNDNTIKELLNMDNESNKFRKKLKKIIEKYRETETLNSKLLKDSFFAAKQKVENYFNQKDSDTYTSKKEQELWPDNPILLDQLI